MGLFDLFSDLESEDQPDWRQSVDECLGGDEVACEWVHVTAQALPANLIGTGKRLSPEGYETAATRLGVPVASIKAVCAVEALGSGFLKSGRLKILYEAHKFSAATGRKYDQSNPNISAKSWNKALYGAGGEHQYVRMEQARKLNETAALASVSWGMFQILGSNYAAAGFPSVHAFVFDQLQGEDNQLMAFCSFVKSSPAMHKALIRKDWATFARLYNGPGYKANAYDTKLAAAFKKYGGK
ncbi:N-acetylmuramidase family protein [Rhizobium leguminosarum]|uniref:N-acetylmuramidase family protein n=1 Tax=Rhizobium leguminosarum TaxID=384 RepID=UPI001C9529E7|nr:N-acetylmuramidase family protein [Rhizobium leguminosarum]MBY5684814.1 N-acetylmuramidase family protein [Rhizobium leguminosarum]